MVRNQPVRAFKLRHLFGYRTCRYVAAALAHRYDRKYELMSSLTTNIYFNIYLSDGPIHGKSTCSTSLVLVPCNTDDLSREMFFPDFETMQYIQDYVNFLMSFFIYYHQYDSLTVSTVASQSRYPTSRQCATTLMRVFKSVGSRGSHICSPLTETPYTLFLILSGGVSLSF